VSAEEIRGMLWKHAAYRMATVCSFLYSNGKNMSNHWAGSISVFTLEFPVFHSIWSYVCAITCMFTLPVCTPALVWFVQFWCQRPIAEQPPFTNSRAPNEMLKRKLLCSTVWLTLVRVPEEEAALCCLWLTATHWECTFKTIQATSLLGAKLDERQVIFMLLLNFYSHQIYWENSALWDLNWTWHLGRRSSC